MILSVSNFELAIAITHLNDISFNDLKQYIQKNSNKPLIAITNLVIDSNINSNISFLARLIYFQKISNIFNQICDKYSNVDLQWLTFYLTLKSYKKQPIDADTILYQYQFLPQDISNNNDMIWIQHYIYIILLGICEILNVERQDLINKANETTYIVSQYLSGP